MKPLDLNCIPEDLSNELFSYALDSQISNNGYGEFDSTSILNVDQPDLGSFTFDDFESQLRADFAANPKLTEIGGVLSSMMLEAKESYRYEQAEFANPRCEYRDFGGFSPKVHAEANFEDNDGYFSWELEEENEQLTRNSGKKRAKKIKRYLAEKLKGSSTIKLSGEAAKAMGRANDAFVKRKYDTAIEGFLEVIRLAPKSHEPYHSLGLIYEELGELQKAICYYFLSAQLNCNDVDLWKRLTTLCRESGKYDLAFYTMGRALRQQPDFTYSRERIQFASECGYRKSSLRFMQFHALTFPSDLENIKRLCTMLMQEFRAPKKAFEFLLHLFDSHCDDLSQFTYTHLNFLSEIAYLMKDYHVLEKYIHKYGQRIATLSSSDVSALEAFSTFIHDVPAELHANFIVGKVHCGKDDFELWFKEFVNKFPYQEFTDLYMQIAQAFMETNHFENAVLIYNEYLHAQNSNSILLLGKLVDCYVGLKKPEVAMDYCQRILSIEPGNDEAKFKLFSIYSELGMAQNATQLLTDMHSNQPPMRSLDGDAEGYNSDDDYVCTGMFGKVKIEFYTPEKCKEIVLEYQKFALLLQDTSDIQRNQLITSTGSTLIANLLTNGFVNQLKIRSSRKLTTKRQEYFNFAQIVASYEQAFQDDQISKSIATCNSIQSSLGNVENRTIAALHGLNINEWFDFVCKYALFLTTTMKRYREACTILHQAANLNIFHCEPRKRYFFKFLQLGIAMRNCHDPTTGLVDDPLEVSNWFYRYYQENPKNIVLLWATATAMQSQETFVRYLSSQKAQKRFKRFFSGEESISNALLYSTNSLLNMTFNYTATTCQKVLERSPDCELMQFYLAIALLHRSISRRCSNKQFYILKSISLLTALHSANPSQESYYNLGRAFHFLGILGLAEHYYKLALAKDSMNLTYQIGYNLHMIYLKSDNPRLARQMLERYCRIG